MRVWLHTIHLVCNFPTVRADANAYLIGSLKLSWQGISSLELPLFENCDGLLHSSTFGDLKRIGIEANFGSPGLEFIRSDGSYIAPGFQVTAQADLCTVALQVWNVPVLTGDWFALGILSQAHPSQVLATLI